MRLLYIAGPYGVSEPGWSVSKNICRARDVVRQANERGWAAYCPMLNVENYPRPAYLEPDLAFLDRCDALLLFPGGTLFNGGGAELTIAQAQGIPVVEYAVGGLRGLDEVIGSNPEGAKEAAHVCQCSKEDLINRVELIEWLAQTERCYKSIEIPAKDLAFYEEALNYKTAQKVVTIIKNAVMQDRLPTDFSAIKLSGGGD